MRKSFSVVPGVRVNLSGKSVGLTVGGKLARTTMNSRTGTRTSFSLPGTGISYSTSAVGKVTKAVAAKQGRPQSTPPTALVRPGLLAPRGEKELYEALENW